RPLDALVAGVDDGFLVQGVLGAHTANVATGEFSVTAPAVWRIRKGAVEGACREIAIAGGLGDLLGKVDGASVEAKRMQGALLPALRVRGLFISV
ncbi:MAG TPA: metallopeptidase TldD-related protein, partial [Candidatus Thermoplasmatota archaeon]|nr:metallopeptidase TldD-related protein [Candidatus Thermoplasmatota archaeon]